MPSPVIGMVGTVNKDNQMGLDFKQEGQTIYLLGEVVNDINSSEYLYNYCGVKLSDVPYFDMDKEFNLQQAVKEMIKAKALQSAHDVSDGGLFMNLLESAMERNLGFDITTDKNVRLDAFLFGESQSRIVVTVNGDKKAEFERILAEYNVPCRKIGTTTSKNIAIDGEDFGCICEYKRIFDNVIGDEMEK